MTRCSFLIAGFVILSAVDVLASVDTAAAQPERLPYSGSLLVARGLRNGTTHLSAANVRHEAVANAQRLNCRSVPCALPNVLASVGATAPVNETPIAVNPVNGKQLIAGGNDYNCGSTSYRGFWTSNDGGKTWSGDCGLDVKGAQGGFGDPIVGYDLNGTVYQGGIDATNHGVVIAVGSSSNNGRTWTTPVPAMKVKGLLSDKPWLQVDINPNSPNKNHLYVSSTEYDSNNRATIYVAHSIDGGKTWSAAAASPTANEPATNQNSDLATGSDGVVYLTYMYCLGRKRYPYICAGRPATLYLQKSTDGGDTWSKQVAIGVVTLAPNQKKRDCGGFYGGLPNTCEPVSEIPVIGVDNSGGPRNGRLYVVEYNWTGQFMQVQVTSSIDGGESWSTPVAVAPSSDTHDQFFPWLNVDSRGNVGVTWLDRRNDPNNLEYEAFATWSSDGGNTFQPNVQIARKPSNPENDGFGGTFMGDYTGNAWFGSKLLATWADTRNGSYAQDELGGMRR